MTNLSTAIYSGKGTITASFSGYLLNLKQLLGDNWNQTADLLIMPGGQDRPYHADLQGLGNQKIRQFVEKGGTYLGICAGAYYGCKQVEFDKGFPLEVCEERELCFFSGKAIGPAYGKGTFDYNSSSGARAARLLTTQGELFAYYNGGCFFEGDFTDCKIIARYADLIDQPPAIIECSLGKGRAILSGVHLETGPSNLNPKDPHLRALIPILGENEQKRATLWDQLLKPSAPKHGRRSDGNGDEKWSVLHLDRC